MVRHFENPGGTVVRWYALPLVKYFAKVSDFNDLTQTTAYALSTYHG